MIRDLEFDKAVVGDKVWHIKYGWGVVKKRHFVGGDLTVIFENGIIERFTCSGYLSHTPPYLSEEEMVLFWSEDKLDKPIPENVRQRFYRAPGVLIDPSTGKFELGIN